MRKLTIAVISLLGISLTGFSIAHADARNLPGVPIVTRAQRGADESMKYASREEYVKIQQMAEEAKKYLTEAQEEQRKAEAEKNAIARNYALQNFPNDILLDVSVPTEDGNTLRWAHEYKYKKTKIVVHHTVNDMTQFMTEDKVETLLQSIYRYHAFDNGRGDVGYNFIISPGGIIYEGRSGGEGVVGAHATWNNQPSVGIALIGNFNVDQPTEAQVNALVKLITALAAKYNIDPESKTDWHRKSTIYPYVSTFQNYTLVGHRDIGPTECPGENLYKLLPAIRDLVEVNLKTGGYVASSQNNATVKSGINQSRPAIPVTKPNTIITLPTIYNTVKDSYAIHVPVTGMTMTLPKCEILKGEVALAGCMYRSGQLIIGIRKKNGVVVPGTVRINVSSRSKQLTYAVEVSWDGAARSPGSMTMTTPATLGSSSSLTNGGSTTIDSSTTNPVLSELKKNFPIATPASTIKVALPTSAMDAPILMKKNMRVLLYNASMLSSSRTIACNGGCSLSSVPFSRVTVSYDGGILKVQKNGLVRNETILTLVADSGSTFTISDSLTQKQYGTYRGKLDVLTQKIKKIDGTYTTQYALVNTLPLEQYLAGIAEASDSEPLEKTKVLALLTKAYALYYAGGSSAHPSIPEGVAYNAIDDPRFFQKYVGVTWEQMSRNRPLALAATKDEYVVYNNILPILPYFHCSPGFTRSAREKWGRIDTPYLQSVLDEPGAACSDFQGHGVGLSGQGATKKAQNGQKAESIIQYYYPGVSIQVIK